MDMQAPDRTPSANRAGPPSPGFVARMVKEVAATPGATTEETTSGDAEAIRELLDCLNPRDTADAQLAAIAIAAARSAMDNFARAARAGISDDQAVRLRSNGLTAGRTYAMALRYFRKRQADTAPVKPAARSAAPPDPPAAKPAPPVPPGFIALKPGATPIPAVETFQPHDRFGRPIPEGRIDLMTRAQVRA